MIKQRRMRDSQRAKVYASEKYTHTLPQLKDWDEMVAYHEDITRQRRREIAKRFGIDRLALSGIRFRRNARGYISTGSRHGIQMSPTAQTCRRVYLHELAHAITEIVYNGYTEVSWHGPEFCGILCELVKIEHGFDASLELFRNFRRGGVKVKAWTKKS